MVAVREKVVTALNTRDIAALTLTMKQMMISGSSAVFGDIRPPPGLSPCFVGRNEERRKLLRVLERHGSAAITQYGGAGKTQLMVSFAESAHEHGLVPGGIFWITADGNKEKVFSSFVDFVQSLEQCGLPERDKRDTRAVVCSLGRALGKVEGRWLLCVDNADCGDSAEILGDVAKLVGPEHGWLVGCDVTAGRSWTLAWNN